MLRLFFRENVQEVPAYFQRVFLNAFSATRNIMNHTGVRGNGYLPHRRYSHRRAWHIGAFLLVVIAHSGAQTWSVSSPNSALVIEVKQDTIAAIAPNQKNCYYRALLNGGTVLDWSPLGVTTSAQNFVTNLTFVSQAQATVNETYSLPAGKRSSYTNNCNELTLTFRNANNQQTAFHLRAYNEAAAFCCELLGTGSAQVTGEVSGFTLPSGSTGWGHSTGGDEKTYDQFSVGSAAVNLAIPILFRTASNAWALITEAAVYGDYTGCHFSSKTASRNVYQAAFPTGQGAITGTLPWKLPWRVAIIGSTLGPLVESSVVENLNPPCALSDISWIKSGRSTWSWLTQETGDTTQQKRYIDFAGQMGWEYNLIDWNFNKSWVARMCQYAAARNIGNELWYNYTEVTTAAQQSSIFPQCNSWGLKSLKIDFIFENGSDNYSYNQNIMKWYDMTAANLAANRLMVTFHGCTVPRGQRRRWPNLMTWEAVRGYEWVGRGYPGPKHNCMVPFTRNVIGPMDMTPVLFYTGQLTNGSGATRTSTDAHELASSVIFESGIQHFADRPEGYNPSIGKPFLQIVPSAWDDIRFIDGYPGQYVILARRKGNDWYVAGISALSARTMSVPLSFLKAGSYSVSLYKDSTGGTKYTMAVQTVTINPSTPLSVWVKDSGGFCCRIPNSYAAVSIVPGSGSAIQARKHGGMDRLSLYHLVRGAAGGRSLRGSDRIIDIRGKTLASRDSDRLPQGVFVRVRSK
jgi:alpha-glucosidase